MASKGQHGKLEFQTNFRFEKKNLSVVDFVSFSEQWYVWNHGHTTKDVWKINIREIICFQ